MWHFNMKKYLTYLYLGVLILTVQSCKVTWDENGKKVFLKKDSNNGGFEKYEINQFFKTQYSRQFYPRFEGSITIKSKNALTLLQFDTDSIYLSNNCGEFKLIMTLGLLSPQMLKASKEKTNTVCCFEELTYLKSPATKKRMKFLVFEDNMMNPFVYLLELTNENANKLTDTDSFIRGSQVTFLKMRGIQM